MHSIFLRYFDEVARQGSIRKASTILNVSSTSVNRKILGVENQLGAALFTRTPEGVALTEIGKILLEHCRTTLHDYERTKILMDDLRDMRTGHINIAVIDSVAFGILPTALKKFGEKFPDISISITTSQPDILVKSIASGEIDVGVSFLLEMHPDVRILTQKLAPFGIILRPDHPLAERQNVTIKDIAGCRLVRTIDARGRNSIIDQLVSPATSTLSTHIYSNSLFVAKQMILDGKGIGIYTKIGFLDEVRSGQLRFVPVMQKELNNIRAPRKIALTLALRYSRRDDATLGA